MRRVRCISEVSISHPAHSDGCESDGGEEEFGEAVGARRDPALIHEPGETGLDRVPLPILRLVIEDWFCPPFCAGM